MAIRPEMGPTLPALLRRRLGIPVAVTVAVAALVAVVAIVGIVWVLNRPPGTGTQVVHESAPVFNLLYAPGALHVAKPHEGELMRIEGKRGKLSVEVVVRPLDLPPYKGDVTHGLLPAYADGFIATQRKELPDMELTGEGRARVNNAVGYEVDFQSVNATARTYGRDVLLVPDDPEEARGYVTLSLRQTKPGGAKLAKGGERNLAYLSRKAYRSFRFGTERG